MLATQLNDIVVSGQMGKHSIIKMNKYLCNTVAEKKIVIILSLDVLTAYADGIPKQGNPQPLGITADGNQAGANANAALQQQQQQQQQSYQQANQGQYGAPGGGRAPQQTNQYGGQSAGAPNQYQQRQSAPSGGGYGGGSNMAPRSVGDAPMSIFPIKSLSPYQNNAISRWTIRARVVNKSDVKHWSNQRGDGRLFSCTFVDESGEIRATAFNDAVNMFYDLVNEGQVYYVSKAAIKVAKKQFNSVNNEYEMSLDTSTTITPCQDTSGVPQLSYSPLELSRLYEAEKDANIDVIGVVRETGDVTEIIAKTTQRPTKKRELTICDQSGYEVRLTLWGQQAENFDGSDNPVIAVKGARVNDFGGRSLSGGNPLVNPDIPEAHALRGWYESSGSNMLFNNYTNTAMSTGSGSGGKRDPLKFVSQIKDENLGMGEKPDYIVIRGTVVYIKSENAWYPACPNCNKKVQDQGSDWRCEKCDQSYPHPTFRYMMSVSISDHTGQTWVTAFNDQAQQLLGGVTADEAVALKDSNPGEFANVFKQALFRTYNVKLRIKADTFQDETKVRSTAVGFSAVDFAGASRELAELIEQYTGLGR
ncbi:Replication factor A protein 1 [Rhizophlyctis rosea]|nr:Replication factor A protein 1 [Rhizophlyctis rosea]